MLVGEANRISLRGANDAVRFAHHILLNVLPQVEKQQTNGTRVALQERIVRLGVTSE